MIKNTGSIEAKILVENPKIEASLKVRFLRRNDEMTQIMNFKAFILEIETWNFGTKKLFGNNVQRLAE